MDPSVQPTQQQSSVNRVQAPLTPLRQLAEEEIKTSAVQTPSPTQSSSNKEAGPAASMQEGGDTTDEEVQVASQEAKNQALQSQDSAEGEEIELQPAVPEPRIEASVEHVVEKSADLDKPELSEAVKQAGVTHSGPGIIASPGIKVVDNKFGVDELDVSFSEAVREEKKTEFKTSKHWLMGVYEYVWRKINPKLRKEFVKN